MTLADVAVLVALVAGAGALVAANVALQRLARPDRGSERIAGCCGMALPSAITDPQEDHR
jgi:hypothetical protein